MIANNSNPAAGLYYPAVPGARTLKDALPLYVQGMRISAVVDNDGTYTVFAGCMAIAQGILADGQRDLMTFFTGEALAWDAQVENERAEVAAAQLAEQTAV